MINKKSKFLTIQDLLDRLKDFANQPALIQVRENESQKFAGKALHNEVNCLATGLLDYGIRPGNRLAVLAPGNMPAAVACLGILAAGAIVVPIDDQIADDDLRHILEDAAPSMIFAFPETAKRILTMDNDRSVFVMHESERIDNDLPDGSQQSWRQLFQDKKLKLPQVKPQDIAALFYTSGTTGSPKGVPLSHKNICASLNAVRQTNIFHPKDRVLLPLPLHHVYPFVIGLLAPLGTGVGIVFPDSMTGPQLLRALDIGQVTVVIGVPRLFRALYDGIEKRATETLTGKIFFPLLMRLSIALQRLTGHNPGRFFFRSFHQRMGGRLRLFASGGSALDSDLAWRLLGLGLDLTTGYGLTETSPLVAFSKPENFYPGRARTPLPDVDVKIDNEMNKNDESAAECAERAPGEILVCGANVFSGYYQLPEETEKKFTNGWFRTGDLGFLDQDGCLHISGRLSTMIVTEGGENIQPDIVESAYAESDVVSEVGVLEDSGKLAAVIVPDSANIQHGQEAVEAIRKAVTAVSGKLPSYQRLTTYEISRQSLPRTRLGKIRRHLLAQRYEKLKNEDEDTASAAPLSVDAMSDRDQAILEDQNARRIWEWLSDKYPDSGLSPDSDLAADLGIDSMAWLNLSLEVQQQTGVEITEEATAELKKVHDLLAYVAEADIPEQDQNRQMPFDEPESVLNEQQRQWLKPLNKLQIASAWGLWQIVRVFTKVLFRVKANGFKVLPQDKPIVLAANHNSYLDPFVLAAVLDWQTLKHTHWAGWTGVAFTNPLTRLLSRLAQAMPIYLDRSLTSSLAFGIIALRRRRKVVWFPEGERSASGEMLPFKKGVGLLLEHTEADALPIYISGTHKAMPVGSWLIQPRKVMIYFGEPLSGKELAEQGEGESRAECITDGLRQEIADLQPDTGIKDN